MVTEEDKILQAVRMAIKMEIDGGEYYTRASRESGNELGRKLLQALAAEEDIHRQKFQQIYDKICQRKGWPAVGLESDRTQVLGSVFTRASGELGSNTQVLATEIQAVERAMEMENMTYDFYQKQGRDAISDAERDFYQSLAAQEREHHRVLLDYYDYLKDPSGYFIKKEHPSLDGG